MKKGYDTLKLSEQKQYGDERAANFGRAAEKSNGATAAACFANT